MIQIRNFFLSYFLPILAVILTAWGCKKAGDGAMRLCMHTYALCTSAPCVPNPLDPKTAICTCDVEQGTSMATVPCDTIQPKQEANGIQIVYSTYSYDQLYQGKKVLKCPGNTPWTWCLNKKCTIDPNDPKKAICVCDVVRTEEEWITYGGDCDPSTCATSYWSGASLKGFYEGEVFMTKALHLEESPAKWCP